MTLSQQDKDRILQEERFRAQARKQAEAEIQASATKPAPKAGGGAGCLVLVIIIVTAIVIVSAINSGTPNTPAPRSSGSKSRTPSTARMIGSEAKISVDGGGTIFGGLEKKDLDAGISAVQANDDLGLAQLVLSGRIVSLDSGTRVLIIDTGFITTKVRLLEGPNLGTAVWVPYEFVK